MVRWCKTLKTFQCCLCTGFLLLSCRMFDCLNFSAISSWQVHSPSARSLYIWWWNGHMFCLWSNWQRKNSCEYYVGMAKHDGMMCKSEKHVMWLWKNFLSFSWFHNSHRLTQCQCRLHYYFLKHQSWVLCRLGFYYFCYWCIEFPIYIFSSMLYKN